MPQRLRCEVSQVLEHGGGVYSLLLRPETPAPRFLPGQFLHLALDDFQPGDFWPDSRIFSIASSPAERSLLRITFAVKGVFTGRMEKELHPGSRVWVKLPYGEFIVPSDREVCLVAGGTGVTAFTAFVSGLTPDHPHPVHLMYGARLPELLIYRSEVETAARRCPVLHLHLFAEQGAEQAGCLPGRISAETVLTILTNPHSLDYYLSGPPEMIRSLPASLRQGGVPAGQVHVDAWE